MVRGLARGRHDHQIGLLRHHRVDRKTQAPANARQPRHFRRKARVFLDADDALHQAQRRHQLGVRGEDGHDALRGPGQQHLTAQRIAQAYGGRSGHRRIAQQGREAQRRAGLQQRATVSRQGSRARHHVQKSACSPTSHSRPGMEVPQPPFWKMGLAMHGR
ncbi:hypothetical protein D3C86_1648580 [compost metagenome]